VQSARTGQHFTFRIRAKRGDETGRVFFAGLLTATDHYEYLAVLDPTDTLRFTARSIVPAEHPAAKALAFTWRALCAGRIPDGLILRHEGRCGACGRELTHPESIDSGIGPDCRKRLSI
jgi:hypothetical protein